MEKYITNQHRYYTLDFYLKEKFGCKVAKVALNGNFSCPNRDGKISKYGCIFCSEKGSGDFAGNPSESLIDQFNKIKKMTEGKWKTPKYIAYFQANTNTYGSMEKLHSLYDQAITLTEDVVCLSIATRPDCINEEICEYLGSLNKINPVWVELGLQTIHQKTADFINRGYSLDIFENAVNLLRKHNIEVIVHIINGLPNETNEMMLETVKYLNKLDIQGIKIHSLFVLKNTILGKLYEKEPFKIMTLPEYCDLVTEQLAILRKDIVVHRVMGDAPRDLLIEPTWSIKKLVVMNEIDKLMKIKNYYQGIKN